MYNSADVQAKKIKQEIALDTLLPPQLYCAICSIYFTTRVNFE